MYFLLVDGNRRTPSSTGTLKYSTSDPIKDCVASAPFESEASKTSVSPAGQLRAQATAAAELTAHLDDASLAAPFGFEQAVDKAVASRCH